MATYREPGSRATLSIDDSTSASVAVPTATEITAPIMELQCDTADFHFRFGGSGDAATTDDPICKAGCIYHEPHRGETHLHCLAASGFGSGHTVEAALVAPYPVRM